MTLTRDPDTRTAALADAIVAGDPVHAHLQVIGFGPGGLGIPVAADRLGLLDRLMSRGLALVDKRPAWRWDGLSYGINSNSEAHDFLAFIRADGFFGPLLDTPEGRAVRAYGKQRIPLTLVASFLRLAAERFLDHLAEHNRSAVICGRSVATLEIERDGLFLSRDADGLPIARSSHAVLALGAEEQMRPDLEPLVAPARRAGRLIASESLLRGLTEDRIGAALAAGAPIAVIGSSHSAFSVVDYLLQSYPERLRDGQVVVVTKHRPKIYFTSAGEAEAQLVDLSAQTLDQPTGEINKFDGLRGDARQVYCDIAAGTERRARLMRLEDAGTPAVIEAAGLVVQAVGYGPRRLPVVDADGGPVDLAYGPSNIAIDDDCTVLRTDGRPVPRLYAVGLGHAMADRSPDGTQRGYKVGVNFFHGSAGARIVEQLGLEE